MARLTIIVAFPLMRHTERLWRRRTGATRASREPERLASARIATDLRVLIAKADQPPSVSTANGKKLIPCSSQFFSCFEHLRSSATSRDAPGVSAARERRDNCNGDVTVTSKAAGRPALQVGTKISPGLDRSPGMRFRCSLMGAKEAAVVALKIMSRSLS